MQTDMTIKDKATQLWAIAGLCSLGLCFTACDRGELPADGKDPGRVELRLSASISDSPFSKAGASGPTITTGTAFTDGEHTFGLFVTREDGSALAEGSDDNMKSTLTSSGTSQKWSHTDKDGTNPIQMAANNGEKISFAGYSPWISGATATVVPFNLSSTNPADWIDLLYLSSPATSQTINDGAGLIALKFSHAYCWVTIKMSKLTDKNDVDVKAISLENNTNAFKAIKNKGTINPQTGEATGSAGPIKIVFEAPYPSMPVEGGGDPYEFNFLVPSFMSADIKDSDLVVRVTTMEENFPKVLSFPFRKTHLNADGAKYGFQKGMHNTYTIVYNNSSMYLSLEDWQITTITESTLGEGMANANYVNRKFNDSDKLVLGSNRNYTLIAGNHIYHTYLGEVAENNNGDYETFEIDPNGGYPTRWANAVESEPVYPNLHIAENFAAGGAQVPWKDNETGALVAKQACVEFRDGGFTDWRLPRISECYMMVYQFDYTVKECWSATEADSDNSYAMVKQENGSSYYPKSFSKQEYFYVRCVRDSDNP